MGLSAYGNSDLKEKLKKIINLNNDGTFTLNLKYFAHQKKLLIQIGKMEHPSFRFI